MLLKVSMLIIASLIFLETLRRGFKFYYNTKESFFWVQKNREKWIREIKKVKKEKSFCPEIITLIPILKEKLIIKETMEYFSQIDYPNLKIYLITTEKEYLHCGKKKETTIEIIKKEIKNFKKILHIHYPYKKGDKANQLNYAIKKISPSPKTFIAVYDADSRPEKNIFWYIAADKEKSKIYQQFPIYFKNYNNLSLVSKSSALFQTRWSLGYELPTTKITFELRDNKDFLSRIRSYLVYCIGHGLFIKAGTLKKLGGFPENTLAEDISLGYRASFSGVPIKPTPFFDNVEYAPDIKSAIIQSSRWFAGETNVLKNKNFIQKSQRLDKYFLLTKRLYHLSRWPFGSLLFLIAFLISIYENSLFLILFAIFSVVIYLIPSYFILTKNFNFFEGIIEKKLERDSLLLIILGGYIKSTINCLGPFYHFYKIAKYKICGEKYEFIKTKRDVKK